MVNSETIDRVNGAVSSGKEAVVFHADGRADPTDPGSRKRECAIKVGVFLV